MTGESLRQTDTNFESEENTMKKILALLLTVAMIAAFCACAQQSADTAPAASTDTAAETTTDTAVTCQGDDGAWTDMGAFGDEYLEEVAIADGEVAVTEGDIEA